MLLQFEKALEAILSTLQPPISLGTETSPDADILQFVIVTVLPSLTLKSNMAPPDSVAEMLIYVISLLFEYAGLESSGSKHFL